MSFLPEYSAANSSPLQQAQSAQVLLHSLIVALVVGSTLCLINQGGALFYGQDINWMKVALTFMVPIIASTYGAWGVEHDAVVTKSGKLRAVHVLRGIGTCEA